MVAVSKHLGLTFKTRPLPAAGSGGRERKKRHLKLNLKMCFSWKPSSAAINQGRHFHAPHFSWFLSEFPPFLSHSTLAPMLPTAALAADHSQRGTVGWPIPPTPPKKLSWLSLDGPRWRIRHLGSTTQALFHHPSQIIHCFHTLSWWPTVISYKLKSPLTYRPVFNVAMKEPFYCRLLTCLELTRCGVRCNLLRVQSLVLIKAVKWSDRLPVSVEAEFTEWYTHWEGDYGRALAARWDAAQKRGCKKHFNFTWPVISSTISLRSLKSGWTACGFQTNRMLEYKHQMEMTLCACKWETCLYIQPQRWPSGAWHYYLSQWLQHHVVRLDLRIYVKMSKWGQLELFYATLNQTNAS